MDWVYSWVVEICSYPLEGVQSRWEHNIKMYLQDLGCEHEKWLEVMYDGVQCWSSVLLVLNG
jgi:hypothetical protein